MGSGGLSARSSERERQYVIELLMPTYYSPGQVNSDDLRIATLSWALISDDTSSAFKEATKDSSFPHASCIGHFYVVFYERLFDVHPMSRPLFKNGVISQGKFLVKMISAILSQLDNRGQFEAMMQALAIRHCERGIRAVEYGTVGEVLFYALKVVLGKDYTSEVDLAWKRIYSAMLTVIIPFVIDYELMCDNARPQSMMAFN